LATTYDDVYDRFLSKITDYELAQLVSEEVSDNIEKFFKSAISDFKYCVAERLVRDDLNKIFINTLTDLEQEILAKFMLVHWVTPHILRLENIRQSLGSKDFSVFSGANFLDKLLNLKRTLISEAESDMIFYYYAT
jgi:hypothetical protein